MRANTVHPLLQTTKWLTQRRLQSFVTAGSENCTRFHEWPHSKDITEQPTPIREYCLEMLFKTGSSRSREKSKLCRVLTRIHRQGSFLSRTLKNNYNRVALKPSGPILASEIWHVGSKSCYMSCSLWPLGKVLGFLEVVKVRTLVLRITVSVYKYPKGTVDHEVSSHAKF